jgi:hypothetical protein
VVLPRVLTLPVIPLKLPTSFVFEEKVGIGGSYEKDRKAAVLLLDEFSLEESSFM